MKEWVIDREVVELSSDVARSLMKDAQRYRWMRDHGSCPFAETDDAWDSPDALDAAVDIGIAHEKS